MKEAPWGGGNDRESPANALASADHELNVMAK